MKRVVFTELAAKLASPSVFTKQGKPLTVGELRVCYENARLEYWAQKKAGNNPVYYFGNVKETGQPQLNHCWVVVDGRVLDATLFQKPAFVNHKWVYPELPASKYFKRGTQYIAIAVIPEKYLKEPLDFFPKGR